MGIRHWAVAMKNRLIHRLSRVLRQIDGLTPVHERALYWEFRLQWSVPLRIDRPQSQPQTDQFILQSCLPRAQFYNFMSR